MTAEAELTMKQLRPFWGRVTVMESPVDEEQRQSGLVVPIAFDGDDGMKRGVVLDVHAKGPGLLEDAAEILTSGTVVYYRGGVRIGDVVVVELGDVVAYEADQ